VVKLKSHHEINMNTFNSHSVPESESPLQQRNNPLHGITLEVIVTALVAHFGWEQLAIRIPVRCFSHDPSMKSSLKFLRKTPWARDKVERLYSVMHSEKKPMQALDSAEPAA
jgi:uncharacterized protein (DUF2132 family)